MKTLYLMRHAKSSWGDASLRDFERPLNGRGKRDAPEMGRRLAAKTPRPELIYASPAERALQTILPVANAIDYSDDEIIWRREIYGAGVSDVLQILAATDDEIGSALLIGHNPTMGYCVSHWSHGFQHHFPTAALACLRLDIDSWAEVATCDGELIDYDYPKLKAG